MGKLWEPADWEAILPQLNKTRELMSWGFNNSEIAKMTGQHRATIQRYAAWLRKEYAKGEAIPK